MSLFHRGCACGGTIAGRKGEKMEIIARHGGGAALQAPPGHGRRRRRRNRRIGQDISTHVSHAERQATLLQDILSAQAPAGVEVLVRQIRDGWLSVLITGLPLSQADHIAWQFLTQWKAALERFYDCRGGAGQIADDSHHHPDTQWEQHWVRYEVRHFRGKPYL